MKIMMSYTKTHFREGEPVGTERSALCKERL